MLMAAMRRWNQIVVLVAAIAIAALPLVHNHPLIPDAATHGPSIGVSSIQCAICATRSAPAPVVAEMVSAPNEAESELFALSATAVSLDLFAAAGSRAPPLA
jgi:hypothetical protein